MAPRRPQFQRALLALAGMIAALGAGGCRPAPPPPPPDVVVLLLDTLRPDHLAMHGYEREVAPFLSELRAESTLFSRAYSSSSVTPPSVASLFTGVYPQQHGVFEVLTAARIQVFQAIAAGTPIEHDPTHRLPPALPTLPERLKQAGYRTFAVFSNPNVSSKMGFERGFDRWVKVEGGAPGAGEVLAALGDLEPELQTASPRFVYVHLMDPHFPYHARDPETPLPEPRPEGKVPAADNYDREIRFMDRHLRAIVERLALRERTVLVIASDHGEELRERGQLGHAMGLYAELNRALILIRAPYMEAAARTVKQNVSLIDVLPTVMEAVGRPVEEIENVEGLSLWPLLGPGGPERAQRAHELANRTVFAHRRRNRFEKSPHEFWSAIRGDWRLIADYTEPDTPVLMLFDHAKDPKETTDRSSEHPDVVQALTDEIEAYRARPAGPWERRKLELTEQERAELEAIGYVEP